MELFEYAKVGEPAPYFEMRSTKDLESLHEVVNLHDYEGKWLILFFYPYDFSFVCPTEILALSQRYEDFKALDAGCRRLLKKTALKAQNMFWLQITPMQCQKPMAYW